MSETKTAFIAIVGCPNVGKSSILNKMLGHKVAIVSNKPQTTRTKIVGVLTQDNVQLVFTDTPGYHRPHNKLGEKMIKAVGDSISGVDACLFVVEPEGELRQTEKELLEKFRKEKMPVILAINKVDTIQDKTVLMSRILELSKLYDFEAVVPVSAVKGDNMAELIEELKKRYSIDEKRIYAAGFSMGSGKTWSLFQEYPEVFAGVAPASALFPMKNNRFGMTSGDNINMDVPLPIFYSGGEKSHLPELPFQADSALERIQYAAKVNKCKKQFDVTYDDKESWENEIWGISGDRYEEIYDEARGSYLRINYYDSEDGICRTAFASVTDQVHEFRYHSCENAWKFISQFTR